MRRVSRVRLPEHPGGRRGLSRVPVVLEPWRTVAGVRRPPLLPLAVAVGVLGAAGNLVFRLCIEGATILFAAISTPFGRAGIPLGLVAAAVVLALGERLFPGEVLGYGFPRFLETLHLEGARVKRGWMVFKTVGSAISLGSGASVGREGPIAQIGGSIGGLVAGLARLAVDERRVLVACGSAAGVAATFNAPLAAVMFAQEIVLLGETRLAHLTLVLVAAATSVAVTREFLGVEPVLRAVPFTLETYWDCVSFAALGLLLGLLAVGYIRAFHGAARRARRLRLPRPVVLIAGLALVGVLAMLVPANFSDGYPVVNRALGGQIVWYGALLLAVAKIAGSVVSLASGAPGGVFGPIFFIGAMSGATFGGIVRELAPTLSGPPGSYALVGMGAFLAATTHAPLTAMFLLLEMTENYAVTVPALLAVGLALTVAQRLEPASIDTYGLATEGKRLREESLPRVLSRVPVDDAYRADVRPVRAAAPVPELLRVVDDHSGAAVPVVDDDGLLVGVLSFSALRMVLFEDEALRGLIVAADLCDASVPTVTPEVSLAQAFQRLEATRAEAIPVVDPTAPRRVLGMLSRADLIAASSRAAATLGGEPLDRWVETVGNEVGGARVATVAVPALWVGRSLRTIDPRGRDQVTVLAIRPAGERGGWLVADPDRPFAAGDELVLAGAPAALRALRRRRVSGD